MSNRVFIINPRTSRDILVGGKTWRMLVANGILEDKGLKRNEYSDITNNRKRPALYEADTEEKAAIAKQMIQNDPKIAEKIGITKGTVVKKIGKKLIKASTQASATDMANYTAKCAARMMNREMESLSQQYEQDIIDDKDPEDLEEKLKQLILQEMLASVEKNKILIDEMNNPTQTDFEIEEED